MNKAPVAEDDVVLRVVHTADWHLGKPYKRFPDKQADKLTLARRDAVQRVFDLGRKYSVHAVLCAGDLFDDPSPSTEWWRELVGILERGGSLERPIFLLPGNHDPLLQSCVWAADHPFRRALPPFVHVIDRDDFQHPIGPAGEGVVYGTPCTSRAGQHDLGAKIPPRQPGDTRIRIGVLHGSTFDHAGTAQAFPIPRDLALERGLNYLALGDHHTFRLVPPDRLQPPTVYPGTPEPTDFGEKEPGTAAIVRFNRRGEARVECEPTATWTWEERVIGSLAELRLLHNRTDLKSRVLRLRVRMQVPAAQLEEAERLLLGLAGDQLPGRVGILDLDRGDLALETGDIEAAFASAPEVIREAARRLKQAEAQASTPDDVVVAQRALFRLYEAARRAG